MRIDDDDNSKFSNKKLISDSSNVPMQCYRVSGLIPGRRQYIPVDWLDCGLWTVRTSQDKFRNDNKVLKQTSYE